MSPVWELRDPSNHIANSVDQTPNVRDQYPIRDRGRHAGARTTLPARTYRDAENTLHNGHAQYPSEHLFRAFQIVRTKRESLPFHSKCFAPLAKGLCRRCVHLPLFSLAEQSGLAGEAPEKRFGYSVSNTAKRSNVGGSTTTAHGPHSGLGRQMPEGFLSHAKTTRLCLETWPNFGYRHDWASVLRKRQASEQADRANNTSVMLLEGRRS